MVEQTLAKQHRAWGNCLRIGDQRKMNLPVPYTRRFTFGQLSRHEMAEAQNISGASYGLPLCCTHLANFKMCVRFVDSTEQLFIVEFALIERRHAIDANFGAMDTTSHEERVDANCIPRKSLIP